MEDICSLTHDMKTTQWTFLSNHGRIFCYLAKHPRSTIEGLARDAGLSVAGVHRIIDDLEHGGYLSRERVGRCNRYTVHPDLPMRHRLERSRTVASMLLGDAEFAATNDRQYKKACRIEGCLFAGKQ